MSVSTNNRGGVTWLGLLGLLFIGLKLGGVIDWSWWYVTMPLWSGLALASIFLGIVLILIACGAVKLPK